MDLRAAVYAVSDGANPPVDWGAHLPFGGMRSSFFGDIKTQGKAAVRFFTQEKIITERFWPEACWGGRPQD